MRFSIILFLAIAVVLLVSVQTGLAELLEPFAPDLLQNSIPDVYLYDFVEIDLNGPDSFGMGTPNPFLIDVFVTFTGPQGQTYTVPAYYDGDGVGGMDGSIWRVRFSPDDAGTWSYLSSSTEALLDGQSGTFIAGDPGDCPVHTENGLPNFLCVGRLTQVGAHYLKFFNGPYWLKGGADEPEDFLAPNKNAGFSSKEAAIDFLASKGINSIYILLHNIDGDGKNVWPWVGENPTAAKNNPERFDLAKMAIWEDIFRYIQSKGLNLHLVLEDDSAWTGFNRELYYREMIARFGHHNAMYWNLAEEYNETYTPDEIVTFAQMINDLDPYERPVTVHNVSGLNKWEPFAGDPLFGITSFQVPSGDLNPIAVEWFFKVEDLGWTIPISFDETTRVLDAGDRDFFRYINWSVYMGGANTEIFTLMRGKDASYLDYALHFEDLSRARTFLEMLPFWDMRPDNTLVLSGVGFVLSKPGEVYAVYLPDGGSIDLDLSVASATLEGLWFNPRDGTSITIGPVSGGNVVPFTAPDTMDWVLLLSTESPSATTTPTASPTETSNPTDPPPPTVTPTPTDTATIGPSPTPTDTPTVTNTPTATLTPTSTPTPTTTPIPTDPLPALFSDDFNRADGAVVGNGWEEIETAGVEVGLSEGSLCFLYSADLINLPMVKHSFSQVSSEILLWEFDFNWERAGNETTYNVLMQLGEGALLSDSDQDSGVGVNLVWTSFNRLNESLAYRDGGAQISVGTLSGQKTLTVLADLGAKTYTLSADGIELGSGIPFDNDVNLDTVRFFTDQLNETNFAGRCFDNVLIQAVAEQ